MKVKYRHPSDTYWFRHWCNYFCDQTCLMNFINKHYQEFIRLHPRPEALETPIEDPVKERSQYGWINWQIKEVDNA